MDPQLNLNEVNLVVGDMERSIAFWRLLGLDMKPAAHPDWARHHAAAEMTNGSRVELDSVGFAKQWNPRSRGAAAGGSVVFFQVADRADVDVLFKRVTDAGYAAQKEPEDAFWGARYAIIEDPDGNSIGIMSPLEPSRRFAPPLPPI